MEYAFWLFAVLAFVIIEANTASLVCIWFAVGALAAIVSKIIGLEFFAQFIVFIAASAVALIATKPLVKKLKAKGKTATNADMVIGKNGIVTEEITNDKFAGKVKVAGQEWSAVTADGSEIPKNSKVLVKEISGVKLIVEVVRFTSPVNN